LILGEVIRLLISFLLKDHLTLDFANKKLQRGTRLLQTTQPAKLIVLTILI